MERKRTTAADATGMDAPIVDVERSCPSPSGPVPPDAEASGWDETLVPLLGVGKKGARKDSLNSMAAKIVLGLMFLEVIAFYGVYLNLIVYLQDVLHGDSASNAVTVNFWAGASYLMPVVGAFIADSYWGKYKTVMVGLSISLIGMVVITTSAALPALRPPPCEQGITYCAPATLGQRLLLFTGIYLCAVGIGGAKAALISLGAEQFDDDNGKNAAERERKASYFSWYYAVGNLGVLISGTLLVWVEDKVSWGLGYGVCTAFVALAVVVLAATAPVYLVVPLVGSPLKGACQVLVAFTRKAKLRVPDDAAELYEEEEEEEPLLKPARQRLEHTEQFRCLDKAAVVTGAELEDGNPWRLCTVTQVEELKTLLRLIPIWLTSNSRTNLCAAGHQLAGANNLCAAGHQDELQDRLALRPCGVADEHRECVRDRLRRPLQQSPAQALTPLLLMGLGHVAVTAAVAVAACTEARRLEAARAGAAPMGIAWLLPQYVMMAVSDGSLSVGQLEFFYDQAPETMRGASTAFYFLSCSIGNILSSQLVTLVASVTAAGGRTGWFPADMDDGHLDYYFLLVVGITAVNFAVFVYLVKNYTPKRVR